jgi:hypothetical protein
MKNFPVVSDREKTAEFVFVHILVRPGGGFTVGYDIAVPRSFVIGKD